jgi:hypothetical protein
MVQARREKSVMVEDFIESRKVDFKYTMTQAISPKILPKRTTDKISHSTLFREFLARLNNFKNMNDLTAKHIKCKANRT